MGPPVLFFVYGWDQKKVVNRQFSIKIRTTLIYIYQLGKVLFSVTNIFLRIFIILVKIYRIDYDKSSFLFLNVKRLSCWKRRVLDLEKLRIQLPEKGAQHMGHYFVIDFLENFVNGKRFCMKRKSIFIHVKF